MSPDDDEEPSGESFADLVGPVERREARGDRLPPARSAPARPPVVGERAGRGEAGFRRPDPEEPRLAAGAGVSDRQLRSLARGEPPPEERIDLHGVRAAAAPGLLEARLRSAAARGLRCVLVVHGHGRGSETGEAVLRDGLPGWLEGRPLAANVLAFAPAPRRLGGAGATLVLLRRGGRERGPG